MIVTEGGWSGGYGLYLLKGRPVFSYNLLQLLLPRWAGEKPLSLGKHTIVFDFKYDGPGIAKSGTGTIECRRPNRRLADNPAHDPVPDAGR